MGRDWKAICALPNKNLQFAFAQTKESDPLHANLRAGFPECFREGPDEGPVPLSVLLGTTPDHEPEYFGDVSEHLLDEFSIPYEYFTTCPRESASMPCPMLPSEMHDDVHVVGQVLEMRGKKVVVVARWRVGEKLDREDIIVSPLERIDLNA